MFRVFSGLFKAPSGKNDGNDTSNGQQGADATNALWPKPQGYRFSATMAPCTPLRVLERHGEEHPGPASALPKYSDGQDGLWQHRLGTWKELGDIAKEIESRMASAVGSIPRDGGEFLRFLKSFREIVESGDSQQSILRRTQSLVEQSITFRQYGTKLRLDRADRVLRYLEKDFDGFACGQILRQAGFRSRAQVRRASDQELLGVSGIGKYRLRLIRAALSPMSFEDATVATLRSETTIETEESSVQYVASQLGSE